METEEKTLLEKQQSVNPTVYKTGREYCPKTNRMINVHGPIKNGVFKNYDYNPPIKDR